jgi:predicted DNA-binding protein
MQKTSPVRVHTETKEIINKIKEHTQQPRQVIIKNAVALLAKQLKIEIKSPT